MRKLEQGSWGNMSTCAYIFADSTICCQDPDSSYHTQDS